MIYGFRPVKGHCPINFVIFLENMLNTANEKKNETMSTSMTLQYSSSPESDDSAVLLSSDQQWSFAKDEEDLWIPAPEFSPRLGPVAENCRMLIQGLLDARPPRRFNSFKIMTSPLLQAWGFDNETMACQKQYKPTFVSGRKHLELNKNPYQQAIGEVVQNLNKSQQYFLEDFQYNCN